MKRTTVGLLAVFAIGILAIGSVVAAQGFGYGKNDQVQQAIEQNDFAAWKTAMQASLTQENFEELRNRGHHMHPMSEEHEVMEKALEAGDFVAWKEAAESLPFYPHDITTITEEDFTVMMEMHQARESGDFATAQEIAAELDWDMPLRGHHGGCGMRADI